MAVSLAPPGRLAAVPGVTLGAAGAGIKSLERDDVGVLCLAPGSVAAGVFTQNGYAAPPVLLCRERLSTTDGRIRALIVNSGNANAATGSRGRADAEALCTGVAEQLGAPAEAVLPFSTGVIGEFLPVERMQNGFRRAVASATEDGWLDFARAIMTTDTVPKAHSSTTRIGAVPLTVTGCAKGAGMMRPDMATMLAYVATDATVTPALARQLVAEVADASFNRLTVDGDTSTNDSFVLCCTGAADHAPISDPGSAAFATLRTALLDVAVPLAQAIVRDGEGATRFVTLSVAGARDAAEALAVAYSVAHSPLVKTALFAGDPNWGRFCMAIGNAAIEAFDPGLVSLRLDDVCIARAGMVAEDYVESAAAAVMARAEYAVRIDLGRGAAEEQVWTSDLSYEYVRVNAEYRT